MYSPYERDAAQVSDRVAGEEFRVIAGGPVFVTVEQPQDLKALQSELCIGVASSGVGRCLG